jgi:hypothetical protein
MNKIKPVSTFVEMGYLYVIDENGIMWKKHLENGAWRKVGELPDSA